MTVPANTAVPIGTGLSTIPATSSTAPVFTAMSTAIQPIELANLRALLGSISTISIT